MQEKFFVSFSPFPRNLELDNQEDFGNDFSSVRRSWSDPESWQMKKYQGQAIGR